MQIDLTAQKSVEIQTLKAGDSFIYNENPYMIVGTIYGVKKTAEDRTYAVNLAENFVDTFFETAHVTPMKLRVTNAD